MKVRYIRHIGTVAYMRRYWTSKIICPQMGFHDMLRELQRSNIMFDNTLGGNENDYVTGWPDPICDHCGAVPDEGTGAAKQIFQKRLYDTPEEFPVLGDMYYVDHRQDGSGRCRQRWENCNGMHLNVMLPGDWSWDINSRASNCDKRDDFMHRCWVLHGDPETGIVHVDKNGLTCNAGAGSIMVPTSKSLPHGWHGFLDHGHLCTQRGSYGPLSLGT